MSTRIMSYLFGRSSAKLGRRQMLGAVGASAIASILPIRPAEAQDDVAPFLGSFNFSGGDKERQQLEKAIDSVVSEMNFLVRGIARDKLRKANPIASAISFASDAKNLTVTLDTRNYTAPLDGTAVKVKSILGDDMMMAFKLAPSQIDQLFTGDDKGRTNQLHLDGTTCVMNVRVFSSKLPKDLVYSLTYSKC